jgi:hypothetical protein
MGSFLIVAGNGDTTRVNVEALVEDYLRGVNKQDLVLLLPFTDRPSQGQVWAHQVCFDAGIQTTAISKEGAIVMSLGSSTLHTAEDPVSEVASIVAGEAAKAFLLWDEKDDLTVAFQRALEGAGVPCHDLCLGLMSISPGTAPELPQKGAEDQISEVLQAPDSELADLIAEKIAAIVIAKLKDEGVLK